MKDPATGRETVCLQSGKGVTGVDPATGRELWSYTEGASTIPSTAASAGVLYIPSQGITAIRPTEAGKAPVQLWRANALRPGTSSPVVSGDRVYTINGAGVLSCGDAKDGNRLWQLRMKGPFSASPVMAGRFLYVPNE
ncbi:MAG: PQQ-binding-like beta-propeller repeat protein, partial [Gammaproteobacteria bacterium]|nr:PQQ-binding-like beta-propeller repeat protein [Gammaproteobacteria bacterium]